MTPKDLANRIQAEGKRLEFNHCLIDIFEGGLYKYVEADLKNQLSGQSFLQARARIAPINVLQKIVEKLSAIYSQPPSRSIIEAEDEVNQALSWVADHSNINHQMKISNEYFNMFKYSLIQAYAYEGELKLRTIANDKFLVFSEDSIEPLNPTIFVLVFESYDALGIKNTYHVYDKLQQLFYMMDSQGNVLGQPLPMSTTPFIYINKSNNKLMPQADDDLLKMTKLIPLLLSDLNFASMMQSFSIIYGINVDDENIEMSPNAFWTFKSDTSREGQPSIGVIKPSVDIPQVLQLIQSELSFWLNSKGIRAGSVGSLSAENFSSGISKIIDEMDTSSERQKQVEIYSKAEQELWSVIFNLIQEWGISGEVNLLPLDPSKKVSVNFSEQVPLQTRGQLVSDLVAEMRAGLTTRKLAIKKLNPQLSDSEVDKLISEIDGENTIEEPEDETEQSEDIGEQDGSGTTEDDNRNTGYLRF